MKSIWQIFTDAKEPWMGPGPFENYVDWIDKNHPGARLPRTSGNPNESILVQIGRSVSFHQGRPPVEVAVQASEPVRSVMQLRAAIGAADDTLMLAMVGRALDAGPKLFRPTACQCESLEKARVGRTAAKYTPPFPVCVVEFPPEYAINRIVPSPSNTVLIRPGFVVVLKENGVLAVGGVLPEVDGDQFDFTSFFVSGSTVEAVVEREGLRAAVLAPFLRAALNFLMLTPDSRLAGP